MSLPILVPSSCLLTHAHMYLYGRDSPSDLWYACVSCYVYVQMYIIIIIIIVFFIFDSLCCTI